MRKKLKYNNLTIIEITQQSDKKVLLDPNLNLDTTPIHPLPPKKLFT
jgi:hypothetical protein